MRYVDLRQRREEPGRTTGRATVEPRPGTFLRDARDNPYLSFAAGFGLGIPASWASLAILFNGFFSGLASENLVLFDTLLSASLPMLPSTALVLRGLHQLMRWDGPGEPRPGGEKQLLLAVSGAGGITPVEAALATSLSVDEAEGILTRLADRGHLRVENRDGALAYALPGRD